LKMPSLYIAYLPATILTLSSCWYLGAMVTVDVRCDTTTRKFSSAVQIGALKSWVPDAIWFRLYKTQRQVPANSWILLMYNKQYV
jgi:hypothetical protein